MIGFKIQVARLRGRGRVPAAGIEGERSRGQLGADRLPHGGLMVILEAGESLAGGPDPNVNGSQKSSNPE